MLLTLLGYGLTLRKVRQEFEAKTVEENYLLAHS